MRPNTESAVVLREIFFDWPDGTPALSDVTATFGHGRTGLIGANGSGKSTLLGLIAGQMTPTSGSIDVVGETAYLPQTLTLQVRSTVADLLGIGARVDALRAIEAGDTSPELFDVVGDAWDIDTRAEHALRQAGLQGIELGREVGTLSGGESMLVAIAGLWLAAAPITLLDEPTNNLDRDARRRLCDIVRAWPGTLLVVSHDPALLELMDTTAELRENRITLFGGPLSEYREYVRHRQEAAHRDRRVAEQKLRTEQRQRVEAETKLARRARSGRKDAADGNLPKILLGKRKRAAENTAGRVRTQAADKVREAREAIDAANESIRDDRHIRIELPDPDVPAGRRLAEIRSATETIVIQGPERVAITGPNGAGKTTLLRTLWGVEPAVGDAHMVAHTDRIGYLAQRLDDLDPSESVLDTVSAAVPGVDPETIRGRLAQFLLRGDAVERLIGDLSGGERFRVALARLLLASPPIRLLVMDEPTNNLDMDSVDQLVEALSGFRGGLLVVSHDEDFLSRLGVTRSLSLRSGDVSAVGGLRVP